MIFLLVCLGVLYVVGGAFVGAYMVWFANAVPEMYPWTANWPMWLLMSLFFGGVVLWPLTVLLVGVLGLVGWIKAKLNPPVNL